MMRFVCLLLACAGCDLYEGGTNGDIASGDGSPTGDSGGADSTMFDGGDAGMDAIEEPGPPMPCSTDASACQAAIQNGWTLVAFEPNRNVACPMNFTQNDVVANPTAQMGACTCTCNITKQPSCAQGMVTLKYSNDTSCNTTWTTVFNLTQDGQCTDYNAGTFNLVSHHSYTKLGLTSGTCSGSTMTDNQKLTTTDMRGCVPPQACAEDVCNGTVPNGTKSCIASDGDVTCPAGPFSVKTAVIGASGSLTCTQCTTCDVTANVCGSGVVKFWGDANCTQGKGQENADGLCNPTGGGTNVNHFTYENPVQNVQCVPGTTSALPAIVNPKTVCCRP